MTILFPSLEPIAEEGGRELKLGRFPNRRYEPKNGGSISVRSFGAFSVDASLRISFGVITDEQMAEVWAAYDAAQGDYKPLELPDKFFFGIKAELLAKIPSTIEWHFAPGELKYEQVAPGYTRLEPITFIGQLAEQYRNHGAVPIEPAVPGFGADGAWVASGTCVDGIDWGGINFNPNAYDYFRLNVSGFATGWFATASFDGGFYSNLSSVITPYGAYQAWVCDPGVFTVQPPGTGVGGFLGYVARRNKTTNIVTGDLYAFVGSVGVGSPYDPPQTFIWQFTDDIVSGFIVDWVGLEWAGARWPP